MGVGPASGADAAALLLLTVTRQGRDAPVAGFHAYGEIARTRGTSGFHNPTLVVLALG
jgi:hypothetical protein